jgi:hypothetical protein
MRILTKEIGGKGRKLPLGSRGERNHQHPFESGRISGGNQGEKKGAAAAPCSWPPLCFRGRCSEGMAECARSWPFVPGGTTPWAEASAQ